MHAELTPENKQHHVITLLGELAVQAALASTRQRAYALVLDVQGGVNLARFYAYGMDPSNTNLDWADNLGFPMPDAAKNPIWYDVVSLQQNQRYAHTVAFLENALNTVKRL